MQSLTSIVSYDKYSSSLSFKVPSQKPQSLNLDTAYALKFSLDDKNPFGSKQATYTLYVEFYDPNPTPPPPTPPATTSEATTSTANSSTVPSS